MWKERRNRIYFCCSLIYISVGQSKNIRTVPMDVSDSGQRYGQNNQINQNNQNHLCGSALVVMRIRIQGVKSCLKFWKSRKNYFIQVNLEIYIFYSFYIILFIESNIKFILHLKKEFRCFFPLFWQLAGSWTVPGWDSCRRCPLSACPLDNSLCPI